MMIAFSCDRAIDCRCSAVMITFSCDCAIDCGCSVVMIASSFHRAINCTGWGRKTSHISLFEKIDKKSFYENFITYLTMLYDCHFV